MSFENGKSLNFRCACHSHSPAQNRSIASNERPDTLNPGIKSIWSPSVSIQLPSFPFGCYTNPVERSCNIANRRYSRMHNLRVSQSVPSQTVTVPLSKSRLVAANRGRPPLGSSRRTSRGCATRPREQQRYGTQFTLCTDPPTGTWHSTDNAQGAGTLRVPRSIGVSSVVGVLKPLAVSKAPPMLPSLLIPTQDVDNNPLPLARTTIRLTPKLAMGNGITSVGNVVSSPSGVTSTQIGSGASRFGPPPVLNILEWKPVKQSTAEFGKA